MNKLIKEKRKVLVCDDDRTHLMILEQILKGDEYELQLAEDGRSALNIFNEFSPDIVLLDVNMPLINGYQVCEQIRASDKGKSIPVLMITGSEDLNAIEDAFLSGATDFIPKPIKWPLIKHRIKYMLRSFDYQRDLIEREKELEILAYFDTLTKLPNRQNFTEQLTRAIALAKRQNHSLGVMLIDLDSFKRINENLGHSYGDKVLQEVANRLNSQLRKSDVVTRDQAIKEESELARLGGDEFTVLLSNCSDSHETMQVAQRIITEISAPIVIEQYNIVVTASIGISLYPQDGDNPEDLLKFADIAMNKAKENGKSCFRLHSKELNERSLNRLKLEEYMREALAQDMFELYYQPQINPSNNQTVGAEALLRLHHESLGMISPADFIPIAEDTGLIVEIGYWVIKQACQRLVDWQGSAMDGMSVSVNVSAKQIHHPNFAQHLEDILKDYDFNKALLKIEITESVIMKNPKENIIKLETIKKLGVSLSLDDFGTGYSSLSYLTRFPFDAIKIDRSFVLGLSSSSTNDYGAIVKTIALMAEAMNLSVVVEGVETQEQLTQVSQLCGSESTLIQGFYFSKPLPINVLCEYVQGH